MVNKEIEIKLGVIGRPEDLIEILSTIGEVSNEREEQLRNVYYDTEDQVLFDKGIGLRIRKSPDFAEQTLKFRGENIGGLHSRGEYNVPVDEDIDTPNLSLFSKDIFPEDFNISQISDRLIPLCEIDFTRYSFDFKAMECVFEVAYDNGGINLGSGLYAPINELEIELKKSDKNEDDLDITAIFSSLISVLAEKNLPLTLEPFSKMHRASVLLRNERSFVSFALRSQASDLNAYILDLIKSYENLYGLFLLKQDPQIFSCAAATLGTLLYSLKKLRKSGKMAFFSHERLPVNYRHDLKIIIKVLTMFYEKCTKFEKVFTNSVLSGNKNKVSAAMQKLRKMESDCQVYVIPLKLRVLISMLVK